MLAMRAGPLEFGDPVWLWGLLLLVPVVYLWMTSRVAGSPLRKGVSLALRVALILAIVLSMADTRVVWFNKGICVVFVIDQSQSVPGAAREQIRARMEQEVAKMTKDDRFAVVEFGGDAVLDSLPSPKGRMPPPVRVADPGKTDIARAVRLAMASLPQDRQKRLVLFTDGNQNAGDALREARIAGVKDIDIDVLLLSAERGHEVMVDQLMVPPHVREGAHFTARAILSSDVAQGATLLVTRDGSPLAQMPVRLKAGTNVIDIPDQLSGAMAGGYHGYQVTVAPENTENDTFPANNTGYAFTQVDAPGKVLVVRGKTSEPPYLYNALLASKVPAVLTSVNGLPTSVTGLAPYDCVILENVNALDMESTPQMPALAQWVKDYGGGLVLVGGDDSFGPGGYKKTPLEEVAPVEMDVKREKHLASLAIVIVLDKSGSMGMGVGAGLEKMDLANKGAIDVIRGLEETDYAMVGAVDTEVKWMADSRVLPMSPGNKSRIIDNTARNKAGGGGIYCETALNHAYRLINAPGVETMGKHVIMFADAQDSEQQDLCVSMAATNFARGVTTSVIGLGVPTDPDVPFQKEVARVGHGRWFITDNALDLPKLFAKEAFLVSRKAYVEKKEGIAPTMYASPILEGFTTGVPKVYGYVGTTLKPRATLAMHGLEPDDPLLACWAIGLGKCVAYTSDASSRWGKDWVSWDGYAKFWQQVVRWVAKSPLNNGLATTTVIEGSDGRVVVDAADAGGHPLNNLQLKAEVIAPEEGTASREVTLEQIAPGRYQGHFTASQRGTYLVTVADAKNNAAVATGGGVLSYPAEYRDLQPNAALLRSMSEATGGQYMSSVEGVFQQKPDAVRTFWPLWQTLLIVVASGLLMDVAWRRLNVADWLRPRHVAAGMPVVMPADAAVGALRTIKSSRREVDTQRKTMRERVEAAAQTASDAAPPSVDSAKGVEPAAPASSVEPKTEEGGNYASRLMVAKQRAKEQMREQTEKGDVG